MTKKMRVLIVGCGGMCGAWLEAVVKISDLEVVGLVDLDPAAAEARARQFALEPAYVGNSLQAGLEATRPDSVFDITVPRAHRQVTLTALEHGCHVLGEKPMAENLPHAVEMVEVARRSGKTYAVIQNRRYDPWIRTVQDAISSGVVGTVNTVNADFYLGAHFDGFRLAMEHVLLLDMAVHTFDQARFISGKNPLEVYCHEYNPEGSWYSHGAAATAIFKMSDDVVFNYRGSWCAEGFTTPWECEWRIVGSRGTLLWNGADGIRVECVKATEGFIRDCESVRVEPREWPEEMNGHEGLIRDFVNAVRAGTKPMTHCEDNLKSLSMVMAAIKSSETGRVVDCDVRENSTN